MITIARNIQEMLQKGEVVKAGQLVATKLTPRMEVFGFLTMRESEHYLDLNMQDTRIVANRVVVNPHEAKPEVYCGTSTWKMGVYPIYKTIEICQEEKKLPLRFLRVMALEKNKYYSEYQSRGTRANMIRDPKVILETSTEDESTQAFYQLEKGEITLCEAEYLPIKCVASCFLVLCRRINTITGCMTYELYNAEDLAPIADE